VNVRQIEVFQAVMEAGSVTAAAERLRITQPAASKLIMALERSTRLPLFRRHKRRLVPTQEAQLLYEEIERVFLGVERIRRYAIDLREIRTGRAHIACLPGLGLSLVPMIVAQMATEAPGVHLTLHVRTSSRIVDWLLGHRVDLGISLMPVDHPSVEIESLVRTHAVCVLPRSHKLATRARITPGDLKGESFISLRRDDDAAQMINRILDDHGVVRNSALETNLSEVACRLVRAGVGVSLVDPFTAAQFGDEIAVRPFVPAAKFEVFLLFPAFRPRSRVLESFLGRLRAAVEPFGIAHAERGI
jgi:DNA-binding transcriptional LysR family regulator